jgi:hypothetical protein
LKRIDQPLGFGFGGEKADFGDERFGALVLHDDGEQPGFAVFTIRGQLVSGVLREVEARAVPPSTR